MRPLLLLAMLLIALATSACGKSRGPYASTGEQQRDIPKAERLYREAVKELADGDDTDAESLLREALASDLYHGAAHNNLGVLLLKQDRLYDAAEEFEWARKLLPGHPEPRVNLAIALARGGKAGEAIEAATAALEVRPGYLPAIETIATVAIREGLADASTMEHLDTLCTRGQDQAWRDWARSERIRLETRLQAQP